MNLLSSGQVTGKSERRTFVCWGQEVLCICKDLHKSMHMCSNQRRTRCPALFLLLSAIFLSDSSLPESRANHFSARLSIQQAPVIFLCLPSSSTLVLKGCATTLGVLCVCEGPNSGPHVWIPSALTCWASSHTWEENHHIVSQKVHTECSKCWGKSERESHRVVTMVGMWSERWAEVGSLAERFSCQVILLILMVDYLQHTPLVPRSWR